MQVRPDGRRWDALALGTEASGAELRTILAEGTTPAFEELVGWEFDGINRNALSAVIGARRFKKGFYEGPPRSPRPEPQPFVQGYNVMARQGALSLPPQAKPSEEHPTRYFFYRVHKVVPGSRYDDYPNALLLDYGLGGNSPLFVGAYLRDYLVQVYPDDPTLLLGFAYYALGPGRMPLGFFSLARFNRHEFHG